MPAPDPADMALRREAGRRLWERLLAPSRSERNPEQERTEHVEPETEEGEPIAA